MAKKKNSENIMETIMNALGDRNVDSKDMAHLTSSLVQEEVENFTKKLTSIFNKIVDVLYDFEGVRINLAKIELDKRKALFEAEVSLFEKMTTNSLKTLENTFTQTANDIAFQSSKMMRENVLTDVKMKQSIRVAQLNSVIETKKSTKDLVNSTVGVIQGISNFTATFGSALISEVVGALVSSISDGNKVATAYSSALSSLMASSISGTFNMFVNGFAHAMQQQLDFEIKLSELKLEQIKVVNEVTNKYLELANEMIGQWESLVKNVQELGGKIDTEGRKLGVSMGYYGGDGSKYITSILSISEHMANVFGKEATELFAAQKVYAESSDRNVILGKIGQEAIAGTERLYGMSQSEAASLYGGMNVFNTSISDGSDMMTEMYKTITRMGLSSSKFGKELVENLKAAQKYNFKGGVDNMMKLTQWAEQARYNLNSAVSFADKIIGGELSDALETSAKLQVLGGAASIYSDPLGMLYDAGADVGRLAHRQANMFNDLTGTFDKTTGETTFSWYENYMIKQRAAAMGMDEADAKNMIRQKNKQGVINRQLSGYGLSEEEKIAIGNRATYDRKENKWILTNLKGESVDIADVAKSPELLSDILPENNDDAMIEIAKKSLGYQEEQTNLQKAIVHRYAYEMENTNKNAAIERTQYEIDFYNKFDEKIRSIYEKVSDHVTVLYKKQLDNMRVPFSEDGLEMFMNAMKGFEKAANLIDPDGETGQIFFIAMEKFSDSVGTLSDWISGIMPNDVESTQKTIDVTAESLFETAHGVINEAKKITNFLKNGSVNIPMELFNSDTMMTQPFYLHNGYGDTNGGYLFGGNTNVTAINDGIVKTHPQDQFLAAKPGGPFDTLFNGVFREINAIGNTIKGDSSSKSRGGSQHLNINISGSLNLHENGNSYNILEKMKTNDVFATEFASVIAKQMSDVVVSNASGSTFNWGSV